MKGVKLDYGDGYLPVDLPDSAEVVRYGETYTDPPAVNPYDTTRAALEKPLGLPPLPELGGAGRRVVIGFPDRVKGGSQRDSHRRVAIPLVVEELLKAGTRLENITLLCCGGLHRKNTVEEWYSYLGKEIVDRFWPDRLVNHDAEAPDMCDFGTDALGNPVQCNRLMAESDLPIVIGHCAGNPYGGYSGGYKMIATGITGRRSIASHHRPATMHRSDWLGAGTGSHMRRQFHSIGQAMQEAIGKRFFAVDAVIGQRSQVLDVKAGDLDAVEAATWPLANQRTNIELSAREPADVLVMGLPRDFHYGPGMGSNPILMSLAIGGQFSRCWHALREGAVIIAAAVCDGWFNEAWFPSYRETYDALQKYCTAAEFLESADAVRIASDPEYCFRYSSDYAYHPFHGMSMVSGGSLPLLHCPAVYIVGAKAPGFARGMGFTPVRTFNEAMAGARKLVGARPRILCTPEAFSGGVGVHLHRKS